ncbi:MAG TPA: hypothetical protein PLN21_16175 [Gemmatales bacterium]|nr:hypothetical protein [Gemmatales bacterium]
MPTPTYLLERLSELAQQERRLRLVWGLARWAAVVIGLLLICCGIDWWIDLWYDTPGILRWLLRLAQIGVASLLFYRWIIQPQRTGLSADELVQWVESQKPEYQHQLISAVQLNAEGADRKGMSESLIGALTQEAELKARTTSFTILLSLDRLIWSVWLLLPTVLIPLILAIVWSALSLALLQRQFGSDVSIPRSVQLATNTAGLWPSGEPVVLKFLAMSSMSDVQKGLVEIIPDGQTAETYPLTIQEPGPWYGKAVFTATIPASSTPFSYRAWLGDGRTHEDGHITFAPRPTLTAWEAWLLLPKYVGLRPDQQPYELPQPKGDLKPVPGCTARISVTTQTPIVEAYAELLAPLAPDLGARLAFPIGPVHASFLLEAQRIVGWTPIGAGPLFLMERVPLKLQPDGLSASALVNLPNAVSAYRIVVTDQHGLTNRPIPRRAITFHLDELPVVTLLPERFTNPSDGPDDIDLEGMPIPLDRSLRIGYVVRDDLALDSVTLRYRLNEGPWEQLPLTEVKTLPAKAKFDVRSGAFDVSGPKDQVSWFALPPDDASKQLGRSLGGGRFDFQTRAIPGLKIGDVLEYYLEARDRHDDTNRLPGRSVVRRKTIVTEAQFVEWLVHTVQQENRLRQVEKQQKKVFEPR